MTRFNLKPPFLWPDRPTFLSIQHLRSPIHISREFEGRLLLF